MSSLFFNLTGVPSDEADDVRALLNANGIAFYETHAGLLGISLPAIWLHDAEDMPAARLLFADYQLQRATQQRALYRQRKQQGLQPSFWSHNFKHPIRFISHVLISALIVYVSFHWLLKLGQ